MKNKKRGFTLIELLVVVLIIGILAAVALPQYQKAVDKARMGRLIPMTRSIADAQQRYFLANGELAKKAEDLDLGFNTADIYDCTSGGASTQCIHFGDDFCTISSGARYSYCKVVSAHAQYGLALPGYRDTFRMGTRGCIGTNERGYKLCQALGGQLSDENGSSKYYAL